MLLALVTTLLPIELLLQTVINDMPYCVTVISETPLHLSFKQSFIYLTPKTSDEFVNQILTVSEMGCSNYIVRMKEPEKFLEAYDRANHIGILRKSDRKLIFLPFDDNVPAEKLLTLLSLRPTKFIANFLVILPSEKQENCMKYDLVTHRFVGENTHAQEPEYLDTWNCCTEMFEKNSNLFPHDMKNLYGKVVRVAAFNYKPYSIFDVDTSVAPLGRDGTEIRIMDEFCRWLNCTVEFVREEEYQWGEIFANETGGVGVLGSIEEDRADFGISALYSWYEEFIHLDFSTSGIRTAITCIVPAPRLLASWEMPLLPFSLTMWLALLFTFIYTSLALSVAQGFSTDKAFLTTFGMIVAQVLIKEAEEGEDLWQRGGLTHMQTLNLTPATTQNRSLWRQRRGSQEDVGRSWRVRSVTGWLLVTGLILDNAYGAGLASTFTVPKYERSIDTVQDIVDRGMPWGATADAWIFSLTMSQEPLIKQLVSQFRIYNAEELKQKSFTRNMAFSIEKLPAGYFAIGEYITQKAVLDMMPMLEDFYYEQCVVMMRKSSPYTVKISELIGRLHESGLMLAWETQVALNHLDYKVQLEVKLARSKRDVDIEALSFRHVVGIFIIYIIGVLCSVVVLIFELILKAKKEKSRFS